MLIEESTIDKLEELCQRYLDRHEQGGYGPTSVRIREGHLHAFFLFLRGEYDPARDFGKRRK